MKAILYSLYLIKWKNIGIENFKTGLISLNIEIKINPRIPDIAQADFFLFWRVKLELAGLWLYHQRLKTSL